MTDLALPKVSDEKPGSPNPLNVKAAQEPDQKGNVIIL